MISQSHPIGLNHLQYVHKTSEVRFGLANLPTKTTVTTLQHRRGLWCMFSFEVLKMNSFHLFVFRGMGESIHKLNWKPESLAKGCDHHIQLGEVYSIMYANVLHIYICKGISPTRILTFLEDLYEPLLSTDTWWRQSILTHMIVLHLTGHMNACWRVAHPCLVGAVNTLYPFVEHSLLAFRIQRYGP